jgi:hypothetical protein
VLLGDDDPVALLEDSEEAEAHDLAELAARGPVVAAERPETDRPSESIDVACCELERLEPM